MDIAAIISVLQVVVANLPGAVTTAEDLVGLGTKFYESVNGHAPSIAEVAALRSAVDNDVAVALTPLPPAQPGDPDYLKPVVDAPPAAPVLPEPPAA